MEFLFLYFLGISVLISIMVVPVHMHNNVQSSFYLKPLWHLLLIDFLITKSINQYLTREDKQMANNQMKVICYEEISKLNW